MGQRRVLLVDNNRLVLDLIENYLEDAGYDIVRAEDGLEAIDRIAEKVPDIVVTDLIMPKIDGKRLCRYLRESPETAHVPVIVVSGTASEDREDYKEVQADLYLAKCAYSQLLPNIKQAIEDLLSGATKEPSQSIIGIDQIHPRELVKEFTIIKKHYDAILENMAEGVVEVDAAGRVIMTNRSALRVLEAEEKELIGRPIAELYEPPVRAVIGRAAAGFREGRREPLELQIQSNGKILSLHFSPIVRGSSYHGLFVTLDDITERVRLEEAGRDYTRRLEADVASRTQELERRNRELLQANRLKDEFLGVLSHELRTPITPIKGYIELLRDHPDDPALARKALHVLKKQSDHLERMLTDLLDLVAAEAGRITLDEADCNANDVLRRASEGLQPLCVERSLSLDLRLAADPLMARIDAERLEQVVTNLLSNAIKFSREGARIVLSSGLSDGKLRIEVVDEGIGIAAEDLGVIFERFRQADGSLTRRYSGLGIGLALVKKLIDLMGGTIGVASSTGSGSTFTILLPAKGTTVPATG